MARLLTTSLFSIVLFGFCDLQVLQAPLADPSRAAAVFGLRVNKLYMDQKKANNRQSLRELSPDGRPGIHSKGPNSRNRETYFSPYSEENEKKGHKNAAEKSDDTDQAATSGGSLGGNDESDILTAQRRLSTTTNSNRHSRQLSSHLKTTTSSTNHINAQSTVKMLPLSARGTQPNSMEMLGGLDSSSGGDRSSSDPSSNHTSSTKTMRKKLEEFRRYRSEREPPVVTTHTTNTTHTTKSTTTQMSDLATATHFITLLDDEEKHGYGIKISAFGDNELVVSERARVIREIILEATVMQKSIRKKEMVEDTTSNQKIITATPSFCADEVFFLAITFLDVGISRSLYVKTESTNSEPINFNKLAWAAVLFASAHVDPAYDNLWADQLQLQELFPEPQVVIIKEVVKDPAFCLDSFGLVDSDNTIANVGDGKLPAGNDSNSIVPSRVGSSSLANITVGSSPQLPTILDFLDFFTSEVLGLDLAGSKKERDGLREEVRRDEKHLDFLNGKETGEEQKKRLARYTVARRGQAAVDKEASKLKESIAAKQAKLNSAPFHERLLARARRAVAIGTEQKPSLLAAAIVFAECEEADVVTVHQEEVANEEVANEAVSPEQRRSNCSGDSILADLVDYLSLGDGIRLQHEMDGFHHEAASNTLEAGTKQLETTIREVARQIMDNNL